MCVCLWLGMVIFNTSSFSVHLCLCDQILDATRKGNLSRFINHSCDPNCETQKVGYSKKVPVTTNHQCGHSKSLQCWRKCRVLRGKGCHAQFVLPLRCVLCYRAGGFGEWSECELPLFAVDSEWAAQNWILFSASCQGWGGAHV